MNINIFNHTISYFIITIYLSLCTISDIRTKTISRWLSLIVAIPLCILCLCRNNYYIPSLITALVPGLIFIFISFISRQAIGYGDGVVILLIGFVLGLKQTLLLTLLAFILAGVLSLFLLVMRHNNKDTIPFVPFLFISFICMMFNNIREVL